MSNIENPICQFQNCNRIANYRKLKVGNCHLKDTKYEYCGYHRPINSINKKFPYKSIFDKINIESNIIITKMNILYRNTMIIFMNY